jgi:hypothetical protein
MLAPFGFNNTVQEFLQIQKFSTFVKDSTIRKK